MAQPPPNDTFKSLTSMIPMSNNYIILYFVGIVILALLVYISNKLNLTKKNCSKLLTTPNSNIIPITKSGISLNTPLNQYFVKTAYNSCCTGQFKNDYVDACALKNCASQGVRALDFQIYSLNNSPIVSASTIESTEYKEIYNYIDFYNAINIVRKYFIDDQSNVNAKDPLFLIFRLYTTNAPVYDMMAQAINEVYGYGSKMKNMVYILPNKQTLDNTLLSSLVEKVIIIVDPSHGDKNAFAYSSLMDYTSLVTGSSLNNNIYRESSLISSISVSKSTNMPIDVSNNLSILYPDLLNANSNNYDFITTGLFNYVTFIGMNFQHNDTYLIEYNKFFKSCAFLKKGNTISSMCSDPKYSSTNLCKNIKK
jgi:hypothetical protein